MKEVKMKIVFVENRYSMWLWRDVARYLQSAGHEVSWCVMNPAFAPRHFRLHKLYKSKRRRPDNPSDQSSTFNGQPLTVEKILTTDRHSRYFNHRVEFFPEFQAFIANLLDQEKPDIIFGEPTQFYELMLISEAKKRAIPFLYPAPTRFPTGRVTFLMYDSLLAFGGSQDVLSGEDAAALRQSISGRTVIPSYMSRRGEGKLALLRRSIIDKGRISAGWLLGDRLTTPSPISKVRKERASKALHQRWQDISVAKSVGFQASTGGFLLYAMQMQPESNIDVWGYPWNDQGAIIEAAADALLPRNAKLVVKPNPSSKYEIDERLCSLVSTHEAIIPLPFSTAMSEIFPFADGVLSVTGTVIIEAIMSGKPVGVLGEHAYSALAGVTRLSEPSDCATFWEKIRNFEATVATARQAENELVRWQSESYEGLVYDPLNQPEMKTEENTRALCRAFDDILRRVSQSWPLT